MIPVVAVIVVVILVTAVYFVLAEHKSSGGSGESSTTVLAPKGSYYSIPVGQFNGITFLVQQPANLNGTFYTSYGIVLYQMTPSQYLTFTKTLHLDGYEWTYNVTNNAIYSLNLTVQPGSWVLAFVNPSALDATGVGFFTDLNLTKS